MKSSKFTQTNSQSHTGGWVWGVSLWSFWFQLGPTRIVAPGTIMLKSTQANTVFRIDSKGNKGVIWSSLGIISSKNETLSWLFKNLIRNTGAQVLLRQWMKHIPLLPLIAFLWLSCLFLATLRNLINQIHQIHKNPFSETTLILKPNSLKLLPLLFLQLQKSIYTTRNQGNNLHDNLSSY